jgi:predicted HAD superfamily Cof-like phosphohydrolase
VINEIFEFNRDCLGVQPKTVPHMEHKHAMFCVKAIREEAKELEDEHLAKADQEGGDRMLIEHDPKSDEARWQTVHSVDALLDAAYFAIGGLARAGLTVEQAIECFLAVQDANMTKKKGVNARRDTGAVDAVKPVDFVPPERRIYEIIYGVKPTEE